MKYQIYGFKGLENPICVLIIDKLFTNKGEAKEHAHTLNATKGHVRGLTCTAIVAEANKYDYSDSIDK